MRFYNEQDENAFKIIKSINVKKLLKSFAFVSVVSITSLTMITGCGKNDDKEPIEAEDDEKKVSDKDLDGNEYLVASGKGRDVADVPLVIATEGLSETINPFGELTTGDKLAVELTCGSLVVFDRENKLVKYAVDGEQRKYNGSNYTYKGMADVNYRVDEDTGAITYTFTIGEDVKFSDGTDVTSDDLIFSLYAFLDKSYKGPYSDVFSIGIDGEYEYLDNNDVENISGISVLSDKSIEIKVSNPVDADHFDVSALHNFDFPICSLDYYGDRDKFNIEKNQFGFDKGDISSLIEGKGLMGAGAYKVVKIGDDTIYFDANENYFKGCPKTAFLQLKEFTEPDYSTLLTEIGEGIYNVGKFDDGKRVYDYTMSTNDNGEVNGNDYYAYFVDGETYQTICFDASVLCINDRPDTDRSKALRLAFCYLFASNRADLVQRYYGASAGVINYPFTDTIWVSPASDSDDYRETYAYTNPSKGDPIYTKDMDVMERSEKAMELAVSYFEKAGYSYEDGKLVPDKDLKKMDYRIYVPLESKDYACLYSYLKVISRQLEEVGIDLKVYYKKQSKLDKKVSKRKAGMWVQELQVESNDVDEVLSNYFGNEEESDINMFAVNDSNLEEYIDDVKSETTYKKKEKAYMECYKIISEWGVIVPLFQHKESYLFRSNRINSKTVANNMTPYYTWIDEIEKVETL